MAARVNHIGTSDFYGPHVANQIVKQALVPYLDGLAIVTKVGAPQPGRKRAGTGSGGKSNANKRIG